MNDEITHFVYCYKNPEGKEFNRYDLMFSLMSIRRYYKDSYDITIIGELPDYIDIESSDINFIPFNMRRENGNTQSNIFRSILEICKIYERFVSIDDDMIFLKNAYKKDIEKLYHEGEYKEENGKFIDFGDSYQDALSCTKKLLNVEKMYILDTHIPIFINSQTMLDMVKNLNVEKLLEEDTPLIFRELYRNYNIKLLLKMFPTEISTNFKISFGRWEDKDNLEKLLSENYEWKMLNTSEEAYFYKPILMDFLRWKFNIQGFKCTL